jgi:hypothetical protein
MEAVIIGIYKTPKPQNPKTPSTVLFKSLLLGREI